MPRPRRAIFSVKARIADLLVFGQRWQKMFISADKMELLSSQTFHLHRTEYSSWSVLMTGPARWVKKTDCFWCLTRNQISLCAGWERDRKQRLPKNYEKEVTQIDTEDIANAGDVAVASEISPSYGAFRIPGFCVIYWWKYFSLSFLSYFKDCFWMPWWCSLQILV